MPSIINPVTNETISPYQFDGGVSVSGAPISNSMALFNPATAGLKAWNYPLALATGTVAAAVVSTGTVYLSEIALGYGQAFGNIYFDVTAAATGPSTTASFAGLYYINSSTSAALVASTAQIGSAIGTVTGFATLPLTASYTTTAAGLYYVGLVMGATTMPGFRTIGGTGSTAAYIGGVATAANYPFWTNGTGASTLPTTVTLSSNNAGTAYTFWCGMS